MNEETLRKLLIRTANLAVSASTVRNQGASGVVAAARDSLKRVDLKAFKKVARPRFQLLLDSETEAIRRSLPKGARNWGAARKCLNIFLRDVLYSRYLGDAYKFERLESCLEVPLDNDIATRLMAEDEGKQLPRWHSIKGLTTETSDCYQDVAHTIAARMGLHRVHLDLHYWRRSQE